MATIWLTFFDLGQYDKEEGSGTAPLLKLFFSPKILGNMSMLILGPQHDRDMQARTTTVLV